VIACSSSAAPPAERPQPQPAAIDAAPDAAVDAGVPDAVANAPAWIFRYQTAQRTETWTLRYHDTSALITVETAQGVTRYIGSANDGASLALHVATATAKLELDCKHKKRPLSAKCNDAKGKPVDVLDCYHPDFKEPMPFGREPGVEYVEIAGCKGYRLIAR